MVPNDKVKADSNAKKITSGRIWPDWYPALAAFRHSDRSKANWQLINTLAPYGCLWYLMIRSIQLGYPHMRCP